VIYSLVHRNLHVFIFHLRGSYPPSLRLIWSP
jgi:hypothetical protein